MFVSDPQIYISGSLVLLAGPAKLNRSVGQRPDCMPQRPPAAIRSLVLLAGPAKLNRSVGRGQTACLSDPQSYISGSLVLLAGPAKLNRSVE